MLSASPPGGSTSVTSGVENFGLFQPATGAFRNARWLKEEEALSLYDIDPNDVLDFKSKTTVVKLSFLGPWEKVNVVFVSSRNYFLDPRWWSFHLTLSFPAGSAPSPSIHP